MASGPQERTALFRDLSLPYRVTDTSRMATTLLDSHLQLSQKPGSISGSSPEPGLHRCFAGGHGEWTATVNAAPLNVLSTSAQLFEN